MGVGPSRSLRLSHTAAMGMGKAPGSMLQSSDPKPEENRQPEMPRVQNLDALVRGGALD